MEVVLQSKDILEQIFLKLHLKSLARCACVNKKWRKVATSSFITRLRTQNVLGIFHVSSYYRSRIRYISFDSNDSSETLDTSLGLSERKRKSIFIKAACNGLVFIRISRSDYDVGVYMLGNVATKSFIHVNSSMTMWTKKTQFGLMFDPVKSAARRLVACTVVPSEIEGAEETFFRFHIYIKKRDDWRIVDSPVTCKVNTRLFDNPCKVHFRNAIHWMEEDGDIIAFDLKYEKCSRIALPEGTRASQLGGYSSAWLGLVKEKMTMLKHDDKGIHIWELKDYSKHMWEYKTFVNTQVGDVECYVTKVPVFYDGDRCVLLSWNKYPSVAEESETDENEGDRGLAVFRIGEKRWEKMRNLEGVLDGCRHFVPFVSHMVG